MRLLFLIGTFLEYLFRGRHGSVVAWRSALSPFSFRVPQGEERSFGRVWTWMRRTVGLVLRTWPPPPKPVLTQLAVDWSAKEAGSRTSYLEDRTHIPSGFLALEDLVPTGFLQRVALMLQVLLLYMLLLPLLIFSGRRRASIGLIPFDFVRLCLMDDLLKGAPVKGLTWFCAYEKGSALYAWYFISERGLTMTVVPSPNPIRNFYTHVVASTFVLTIPFQEDEYNVLRAGWEVKNTLHWPMYGTEGFVHVGGRTTANGVIGFLSSGNWLRRQIGKNQISDLFFQAEEEAMRWCLSFQTAHPEFTMQVLLHPVEKNKPERLELCLGYYKELGFTRDAIVTDVVTREHPELLDVAVSLYSSATFERMHGGYKGLFAQPGMPGDYFMSGDITNIIARDETSFHAMLLDAMQRSAEDFFRHHGLQAYRWEHYAAMERKR